MCFKPFSSSAFETRPSPFLSRLWNTLDTFVKFAFSEVMFEEAPEPKQLYPVPGAQHGSVPCPARDTSVPSEEVPCIATDGYLQTVGDFYDEWLL